ncbi:DUF1653 domain-containing protein [Paenibacillus alvei]|uniref:DUF1653 domain-containing protein n=1 Tax=Paenibacillus alvei TaxID=44250 RepID=A0AAP7A1P2_PAEAL|nr:DUF1653 domain-containing protein [Paenibacillus alvei]NOJ73766.1 DUF1653 domain-containing protein [Paenibacillus alvei]
MFYRHYEGNECYLLGIVKPDLSHKQADKYFEAVHTESGKHLNVFLYKGTFHVDSNESLALYIDAQGRHWVQPKELFLGSVKVDEQEVRRFSPFNQRSNDY